MAATAVPTSTVTTVISKQAVLSAAAPTSQDIQFSAPVQKVTLQFVSTNNSPTSFMTVLPSLNGTDFAPGTFVYGPSQLVLEAPTMYLRISGQISPGDAADTLSVVVLGI